MVTLGWVDLIGWVMTFATLSRESVPFGREMVNGREGRVKDISLGKGLIAVASP